MPYEQIEFIYQHLLSRDPDPAELRIVQSQLHELETYYHSNPDQARRYLQHGQPETVPDFARKSDGNELQQASTLAALSSITSMIMNPSMKPSPGNNILSDQLTTTRRYFLGQYRHQFRRYGCRWTIQRRGTGSSSAE